MDAAHRLIKIAGLLVVIALLMAMPGWAQAVVPVLTVPSAVNLAGTGGQFVTVTSSTSPATEITFTIDIAYAADNNGQVPPNWLAVNGPKTTPAGLNFNLISTPGLIQGTHTATVTRPPTDPVGFAAVMITVTYTSGNPGGGGNGTLTAFPTPVNISASVGSSFQTSVTITTTSTVAVTLGVVTATQSGGGWLAASVNGSSSVVSGSPTSILVTASAFNLSAGLYTGTITVTPSTGSALNLPVNFTVGGTGGGSGSWSVTPNSIPFNFNTNSGIFPSASVTVTTSSGNTSYTASATSSNGWLLFNGSTSISGLSVGQAYSVSVGGAANSLTTGSYQGTITITDPFGATQATITVTLNVNGGNSSGLTINPNPLTVNSAVGGSQQNPTVSITSSTGGLLTITANLQSWCNFQYPSNTNLIPGGSTAFTVNVNPAGLGAGTYSQTINITVGAQVGTLTVNLVVGGSGTGTGTTAVAPTSLAFTYQQGSNSQASAYQKIVITGPPGPWSSLVTTSNNGTWLQLSSTGGGSLPDPASSPIAYIVPTGLAVGSYAGNIAITTGGGTQNVTVGLTVTVGPVLVPTPGSLVFVATTGLQTPGQSVFFSGTDSTVGPLNIQATSNNTWITVSPTASSMSVTVDPTGMAAGIYSGSITVIQANVANTPYTYPVVMVVNGGGSGGAGPLTFVPNSLSFSSVNGSAPPAQNLAVGSNFSSNFKY